MKVEYSSNNSGGDWWLTDENWRALEAAGWEVAWFAMSKDIFAPYKDGRWLGALATRATREGLSLRAAADEWVRVTGLDPTAAGCPCCGQPHTFTEYDDQGKQTATGPSTSYRASWDDVEARR